MTKPYHITQEQAGELLVETPAGETLESSLQAFANAVLDEVLGEPVGEVIGNDWKAMQFLPSVKRSKANGLSVGAKLYAPRREKCPPHKWNKSGEKCLVCGDKDWMD